MIEVIDSVCAGVNWSKVLFDLTQIGMTPKTITRALGDDISEASIRGYMKKGIEPSHVRGELILDLWCEKTGKRREDAPRRPLLSG